MRQSYAHGTCPICRHQAVYGVYLSARIITEAGQLHDVPEVPSPKHVFYCTKGHEWPVLWVHTGGQE